MPRRAVLAALLALAASSAAAQPVPDPWWARYKDASQQVRLPGGREITLHCEGAGAPVVVLDSGLGDGAASWRKVQGEIARTTKVCAYDRAGLGGSAMGPLPRDTQAIVGDLEALLKAARLRGPYVLVGHSMGSFDVRMYASRNLRKVAGMVLVDPSADDQNDRMAAAMPRMAEIQKAAYATLDRCAGLAIAGMLAPQTPGCSQPPPPDVPAELRDWVREGQGPGRFITVKSELDSFMTLDAAQMAKVRRPLGAIPLIVLTGRPVSPGMTEAETETLHQLWTTMHDEMAALSTAGVNRAVPGSGHYIQIEKPAVVIAAVQEVVEAARAKRR
jgi:pimeloyl-ACP methyl ester carboxylesterase